MRPTANNDAPSRRVGVARATPFILTAGAIFLAWQIAVQPLIQRAPVQAAIRIAPTSSLVLRRAAEAELTASRIDNAALLGREALSRSPFDVRALRVVGLTEARAGRLDAADQIITLAGNWSLRDDPAHAWLVEYRLRRRDYASSFAHADTLVRRREDIQPQVFQLFNVAAATDPQRVLPVIARLLAANPPWRSAYMSSLLTTNEGLGSAANLAILLQSSGAPLSTNELRDLYVASMAKGQTDLVKTVRARLNRPVAANVTNSGFDDPTAPEPFQWTLIQKSGAAAEVMNDDVDPSNPALRVEYDGYSVATIAQQRMFLASGRYRLHFKSKTESGNPSGLMTWAVSCEMGGASLLAPRAGAVGPGVPERWTSSAAEFSVPQTCPSQWIELRGVPLDRRAFMAVWFDQIDVEQLASR